MGKQRYTMVLQGRVIDVILAEEPPLWGPDPRGNEVLAIVCDDTVILGMGYDSDTGLFGAYVQPPTEPEPKPTPEPLSVMEQAILDTALNTEYLVCLQDMGL